MPVIFTRGGRVTRESCIAWAQTPCVSRLAGARASAWRKQDCAAVALRLADGVDSSVYAGVRVAVAASGEKVDDVGGEAEAAQASPQ